MVGQGEKWHKRVVKEKEMLKLKAELEKFTGIAVQQEVVIWQTRR